MLNDPGGTCISDWSDGFNFHFVGAEIGDILCNAEARVRMAFEVETPVVLTILYIGSISPHLDV